MSPRKHSSPSSRSPIRREETARAIGLYLHFPFCLSKCAYCDFTSAPIESLGGLPAARRYLSALNNELDLRAASAEFHSAAVDTIYLGGGTPTVLPAEWIAEVVSRARMRFCVAEDAEITVEANPGTVDEAKMRALLAAGVTRVSLGVQSFSDPVLAVLGRCHSAAEAEAAIGAIRAAGCASLNLDLIYGAPSQSMEEWREALQRALAARPEHISAYGLSVEEGTPLAEAIESGELPEIDQDLGGDMYQMAAEVLTGAGYAHYEISNFALPGRECRHNRRYWAGDEYLGAGVSAHSYRGGWRWNNADSLPVYLDWLEKGLLPVARAEALSPRERVGELLILGLRREEGVTEVELVEQCGIGPREVFGDEIDGLCEQGLLSYSEGRLRLPPGEWLISNEVLARFVT
jgi:oxygen-independent coproporphyrinogen-3 oxidase